MLGGAVTPDGVIGDHRGYTLLVDGLFGQPLKTKVLSGRTLV